MLPGGSLSSRLVSEHSNTGGDECSQGPVAEQMVEGQTGTKVNFEMA